MPLLMIIVIPTISAMLLWFVVHPCLICRITVYVSAVAVSSGNALMVSASKRLRHLHLFLMILIPAAKSQALIPVNQPQLEAKSVQAFIPVNRLQLEAKSVQAFIPVNQLQLEAKSAQSMRTLMYIFLVHLMFAKQLQ